MLELNGGSIPPGSTITAQDHPFEGGLFFGYRFGFVPVCEGYCGLRRRGFGVVKERVLSLGAASGEPSTAYNECRLLYGCVREAPFSNVMEVSK